MRPGHHAAVLNRIGKEVVTQRKVAAAAGVHASTVSLALRNDDRLPSGTRERVRQVAERLGYAPNPLVSLLMARVRRRTSGYRGTLAYVSTEPSNAANPADRIARNFFSGATRRAEELGYRLNEFQLNCGPSAGRNLTRALSARGIHGVIVRHVASAACPNRCLPFDLSAFATVSIGVPLLRPKMHYVANDQYMRPIVAAREMLRLGYRRLGFVVHDPFDTHMAHRCSAGFWAVQHYVPRLSAIPILNLREGQEDGALERWLERHEPDGVLATQRSTLDLLRRSGRRVPQDIGVALLDWVPDFAPAAGVYGNSEYTGMAAVEMVVSQIHRGEKGPPPRPACHLIAGSWIEGKTLARVGPPAADLDATFFADIPAI